MSVLFVKAERALAQWTVAAKDHELTNAAMALKALDGASRGLKLPPSGWDAVFALVAAGHLLDAGKSISHAVGPVSVDTVGSLLAQLDTQLLQLRDRATEHLLTWRAQGGDVEPEEQVALDRPPVSSRNRSFSIIRTCGHQDEEFAGACSDTMLSQRVNQELERKVKCRACRKQERPPFDPIRHAHDMAVMFP